jgi:hypothetical protein
MSKIMKPNATDAGPVAEGGQVLVDAAGVGDGLPGRVVKMSPYGLKPSPWWRAWACCRRRCAASEASTERGSTMRRWDPIVLVGSSLGPSLVRCKVRTTVSVPPAWSRSVHFRPSNSPRRRPVRRASSNSTRHSSAWAAARSRRASCAVKGSNSRPRGLPSRTAEAALRVRSSSRIACANAEERMARR